MENKVKSLNTDATPNKSKGKRIQMSKEHRRNRILIITVLVILGFLVIGSILIFTLGKGNNKVNQDQEDTNKMVSKVRAGRKYGTLECSNANINIKMSGSKEDINTKANQEYTFTVLIKNTGEVIQESKKANVVFVSEGGKELYSMQVDLNELRPQESNVLVLDTKNPIVDAVDYKIIEV